MLGIGDTDSRIENYIRLDYLPAVFLFADHSEYSVPHVARLEGQYRINRLTLTMSRWCSMDGGCQTQGNLAISTSSDSTWPRTRFNITRRSSTLLFLTGKRFCRSAQTTRASTILRS